MKKEKSVVDFSANAELTSRSYPLVPRLSVWDLVSRRVWMAAAHLAIKLRRGQGAAPREVTTSGWKLTPDADAERH